jgi:Zn-dependent peptidase ImmA (M78 family)
MAEVADSTGIDEERLRQLEAGSATPSGDEVLIFADCYKCDYRFFVSNERLAAFEQSEKLFRRYGTEFSKEDRWRVQEFLFLCECEEFLIQSLGRERARFRFTPEGTYFKGHAEDAAASLRKHFSYGFHAIPGDVYRDFRQIGFHVFRRHLHNSNISGIMIRHPVAGPCILINYSEDVYRQRFTAAHEAAHGILDQEEFIVSFTKWKKSDLVEVRANTFASRYLLPPATLANLPVVNWNNTTLAEWANRLKVSAIALAIGLKESGLIDEHLYSDLSRVKVSSDLKIDPELVGLDGKVMERKRTLLERGLSTAFVTLCFDALFDGVITNARAAEMLLVSELELSGLAPLFNVHLSVHE